MDPWPATPQSDRRFEAISAALGIEREQLRAVPVQEVSADDVRRRKRASRVERLERAKRARVAAIEPESDELAAEAAPSEHAPVVPAVDESERVRDLETVLARVHAAPVGDALDALAPEVAEGVSRAAVLSQFEFSSTLSTAGLVPTHAAWLYTTCSSLTSVPRSHRLALLAHVATTVAVSRAPVPRAVADLTRKVAGEHPGDWVEHLLAPALAAAPEDPASTTWLAASLPSLPATHRAAAVQALAAYPASPHAALHVPLASVTPTLPLLPATVVAWIRTLAVSRDTAKPLRDVVTRYAAGLPQEELGEVKRVLHGVTAWTHAMLKAAVRHVDGLVAR
ncbi:hypothetical protein H9P43_007781 [Blastocladiella emersonii ATCC 22665]|nr:hypothetical protein H9P43_007781 [Blastocladiella emersonii ATCC 22665]